MNKWFKYSLWGLVLVAILTAAHIAFWQRYMVERDYRQVELAVNYDEIDSIAGLQGKSTVDVLKMFKDKGVTSVVFREPTVDDLQSAGDLSAFTGQNLLAQSEVSGTVAPWLKQLLANNQVNPGHSYLLIHNRTVYQQVKTQLAAKAKEVKSYELGGGIYLIDSAVPYATLQNMGVGFPEKTLQNIQAAGLDTILQIRSWTGATTSGIEQIFSQFKSIPNLSAIMFNDATLPGYAQQLPVLAKEIEALNVPVVQVEFFPQKGLSNLGLLMDKKMVRLHTISPKEMTNYTPASAVSRYVLAATERNEHILLVRPFVTAGIGDVLQENLALFGSLNKNLAVRGLTMGRAQVLPPIATSRPLLLLIGLGVIAGGLLLLNKLGLSKLLLLLGALAVLVWLLLLWKDLSLARKVMALAATIIFPTLAVVSNVGRDRRSLGQSILVLLRITLTSWLGALFTVGLLANTSFMLELDQFMGVKLAAILPLLIILVYFIVTFAEGNSLSERMNRLLNRPVAIKLVLVAVVLLAAVALYVIRSGNNQGVVATTGLELQARGWLDKVLLIRPRTKEFLLGYPALLLLLTTGYRDNRFLPLLLFAVIGQSSLVDTFCHVHTPLMISLVRWLNGLWLGLLIGLLVVWLYGLLVKVWKGRFAHD